VKQRVEKLQDAIELGHHCRAEHVDSSLVTDMSGGKVWEGLVEIFELVGHESAGRCYAWFAKDGSRSQPVMVLELPPVRSPQTAVRAALARTRKE
jgi:hypothetical protein